MISTSHTRVRIAMTACIAMVLAGAPITPAHAANYHCTCTCKNGGTQSGSIKADSDAKAKQKCERFGKTKCAPNGGLKPGTCRITRTSNYELGDDLGFGGGTN